MNKFLKNLLLQNRRSDFEIISQKCSLSGISQKLLAIFLSVIKQGSTECGLLSLCFLGDPFQKLFVKFLSVHKHGSGELGLLAVYGHEQILKKSSSLKSQVRF